MPPDVHRGGDGQRLDPAQLFGEARHRREERGQHDARRAAVDGDEAGGKRDDAGDALGRRHPGEHLGEQFETACGIENRNEHRHAADHHDDAPGHDLHGLELVARLEQRQDDRAGERPQPDVDIEEDHPGDQRPDHRDRDPVGANVVGELPVSGASPLAVGTVTLPA